MLHMTQEFSDRAPAEDSSDGRLAKPTADVVPTYWGYNGDIFGGLLLE